MSGILIIPSIDILNGKTVRVVQGIPEVGSKNYGDDPVEMALIWRAENAKMLHIVDFDFSHEHSQKNLDVIREICSSVIIPVEFGGGIKTFDDAEKVFDAGVFRLVIGSLSLDSAEKFKEMIKTFGPERISAAIDVIDNEVVVHGRHDKTGISPIEHAKRLVDLGAERLIITDVKRNGMLAGPNIGLTKQIAEAAKVKVTHSGGISGYKDLAKLLQYSKTGIDSVIIGRAFYENKFPCQKIWRLAEKGLFN